MNWEDLKKGDTVVFTGKVKTFRSGDRKMVDTVNTPPAIGIFVGFSVRCSGQIVSGPLYLGEEEEYEYDGNPYFMVESTVKVAMVSPVAGTSQYRTPVPVPLDAVKMIPGGTV